MNLSLATGLIRLMDNGAIAANNFKHVPLQMLGEGHSGYELEDANENRALIILGDPKFTLLMVFEGNEPVLMEMDSNVSELFNKIKEAYANY